MKNFAMPVTILFMIIIAGVLAFGNPLKVIDPADPKFPSGETFR